MKQNTMKGRSKHQRVIRAIERSIFIPNADAATDAEFMLHQ